MKKILSASLVLALVSGPVQAQLAAPAVTQAPAPSAACGAGTYVSALNGSSAPTCGTPAGTTAGANPSATIGASAVNGSAVTFMRSDAAPALPSTLPGGVLPYGTSSNTAAQGNDTRFTSHTRQVLTSGTGATYTTPANVRQLVITEIGGGGGGAGAGITGPNAGSNGGDTSFNSIVASHGLGGTNGPVAGGTGGTGSAVRTAGAPGQPPTLLYGSSTAVYEVGATGGGQGAGTGVAAGTGGNAVANTGSGAAGGGVSNISIVSASTLYNGYSGSQGETARFIINSPASTYTYTIGSGGAAGAAGTGGFAGGIGGSGIIIVDEYY